LTGGNNFAFGGARTTYNVAENFLPVGLFPWSLNAETAAFASRGINDPNGLYIVFSGSNDVGDILSLGLDPASVFSNLLNGIQSSIETFKSAGAHTILIPNVPDLGLTPEALSGGTSQAATALSAQYNAMLHALLAAETGVDVIEFDTFGWLQNVVANPAAFGLTNVSSACYSGFIFFDPNATECANPQDYLFWDREHPTAAGQALLARQILATVSAAPQPVPEPPTMIFVLLGLSVIVGVKKITRGPQEGAWRLGVSPNHQSLDVVALMSANST
jgi:outer membrane lipase/esterase